MEQHNRSVHLDNEQGWIITVSLLVLATVALAWALYVTSAIVLPFILAVFIVALVSPLLDVLVLRVGMPRGLAVMLTLIAALLVCGVFGLVMVDFVQTIVATAGKYTDSFVQMTEDILSKVEEYGIDVQQEELFEGIRQQVILLISHSAGLALDILALLTFTSIFVIFLLLGRDPAAQDHSDIYSTIEQQMRRYVSVKTFVSSITGILVWSILTIFDLELAWIFGFMAFVLNYIPSVGSIIATFLPLPIALAQMESPLMVALVIFLPGSVQMIIGNFIDPKLMGRGLNLHPVTVMLSLSLWGLLWGPLGVFLATPVTAVLRTIISQAKTLQPVSDALAGVLPGMGVVSNEK